jgi:MOSC domain-containing protein YiiM
MRVSTRPVPRLVSESINRSTFIETLRDLINATPKIHVTANDTISIITIILSWSNPIAMWWEKEINEVIPAGRFGENLTTEGIDVNAALIGERWKIGSVILEVSQPRIPCRVFAGFWKRATLIKDFTQAGRPGTYLRIIQEGSAQAGDAIEVIQKPDHNVSISDLFAAKSGERSKINEIKEVPYLSTEFKEWALKIAATQS